MAIGHNAFEFFLDFGQYQDGDYDPTIHCRIVTAPAIAKSFCQSLNQSIQQYENAFGPAGETHGQRESFPGTADE